MSSSILIADGDSSVENNHYTSGESDLMIGDVVYVNGEGDWRGRVVYLGNVHFAKGEWVGLSLDHPMGNHDGMINNRRYFQCTPNHGIFCRAHRLTRKMQIPETLDAEKLGLLKERQTPSPSFTRMRSQSPTVSKSNSSSNGNIYSSPYGLTGLMMKSRSISRESSPFNRNVSFSPSTEEQLIRREFSRSPDRRSVTPTRERSSEPELKLGDRVIVRSSIGESKAGILRYVGEVDFEDGVWAGVELSFPLGKNDGTVRGREYFRCDHPFGLFVPFHKIESSPANKTLRKRMGTRENLYAVMSSTKGVRAGSHEDYY